MFAFSTVDRENISEEKKSDDQHWVMTSQGAMVGASDEIKYLCTAGLRTCVAFALINPDENSALLIHFFSFDQIKHLEDLVSLFLQKSPSSENGLTCIIAGGRWDSHTSNSLHEGLFDYLSKNLSGRVNLKLRIEKPAAVAFDETLTVKIALETGDYSLMYSKLQGSSDGYEVSTDNVKFTDLIVSNVRLGIGRIG